MKFFKTWWPFLAVVGAWVWLLLLFASCTTTRFVEVEKVLHDTTYVTKQQRDSVWLHDSVLVREKGDTLWVEKWHTKYVERLRTDTVYRSRVDSVPVPYPVEKLVERNLTAWQRWKMGLGLVFLGLIGAGGSYGIYRLRKLLI